MLRAADVDPFAAGAHQRAVFGNALREPRVAREATPDDPDVERVEEDLRRSLGTKVRLTRTRRGGRIVIEYFGDEELARLYQRLVGGTS